MRSFKKSSNKLVWKVVAGAAFVLVAAGLIVGLPDIKRYIKIVRM
jgi:hypothetical protein